MQKFLLKIILFFIAIVIANLIYLVIIKKTDFNFRNRIESLQFQHPKFDLLVLGNSLAMDGIDAQLLTENGYNSYNLALGGSSMQTIQIQLEEYLSMYKHKPKYIVLGLGSYINNIENQKLKINPIVEYTKENRQYKLSDIPMLKFKWLFISILKKIVSKNHREAELIRGQVRFQQKKPDNTKIDTTKVFPLHKYKNSTVIQSIIEICNNHNIKLLIVEMPSFKKTRYRDGLPLTFLDSENKNGILINYNTVEFCKIFNDNTDWIGNSHLNMYGASKFTKEIVKSLDSITNIKP